LVIWKYFYLVTSVITTTCRTHLQHRAVMSLLSFVMCTQSIETVKAETTDIWKGN